MSRSAADTNHPRFFLSRVSRMRSAHQHATGRPPCARSKFKPNCKIFRNKRRLLHYLALPHPGRTRALPKA